MSNVKSEFFKTIAEARVFAKKKRKEGCIIYPSAKVHSTYVDSEAEAHADYPTAKEVLYEVRYEEI